MATISPGTLDGRHPGTVQIARYFDTGHLPDPLRYPADACAELAEDMIAALPDGPELTAGLRKLLEAKDCFVRAAIAADGPAEPGERAST
jgi:hypothetical protein